MKGGRKDYPIYEMENKNMFQTTNQKLSGWIVDTNAAILRVLCKWDSTFFHEKNLCEYKLPMVHYDLLPYSPSMFNPKPTFIFESWGMYWLIAVPQLLQ